MDVKKLKRDSKKAWKNLKKFVDFVMNDDSPLSWILNILFAIIIIKFMVYPGLGFLLSTPYPIVAVVSGSMEHAYAADIDSIGTQVVIGDQVQYAYCGNTILKKDRLINFRDFTNFDIYWDLCGAYYEDIGITKDEFDNFPFKNGFNTGDIMLLYGTKPKDLKIGDIIVFGTQVRPDPIIHRVIDKWEVDGKYHFKTKGDHNSDVFFGIGENDIVEDRVIARAVIRIPYLGWVKIGAFNAAIKLKSLIM